jgi:hypothetical protein
MPLPATVVSQQIIQIGINGPGDVASMYVISGIAEIGLTAFAQPNQSATHQDTFSAPIGPQLTAAQFRKAIASASIASLSLAGSGGLFEQWKVSSVDADFNEDSGLVELEFDVSVKVSAGAASIGITTAGIGFQVFILTT